MNDSDKKFACSYCKITNYIHENTFIKCKICKKWIHSNCLIIGSPSKLLGDSFFLLKCIKCLNGASKETIQRFDMNWLQITHLTLFNLTKNGDNKVYFRWREEICQFIKENWNLFKSKTQLTETWEGTVAGVLSMNSPSIFKSGSEDMKQSGWWGLQDLLPPLFDPCEDKNKKRGRPKFAAEKKKSNKEISVEPKKNKIDLNDNFPTCSTLNNIADNSNVEMEDQKKHEVKTIRKVKFGFNKTKSILMELKNNFDSLSTFGRRYYHKILIKHYKEVNNIPYFNLEEFVVDKLNKSSIDPNRKQLKKHDVSMDDDIKMPDNQLESKDSFIHPALHDYRILDRYSKDHNSSIYSSYHFNKNSSFYSKLNGENCSYQSFKTAYSSKTLKPFIWRDYESKSTRMLLNEEIHNKCTHLNKNNNGSYDLYQCLPIDYVYVQPEHIDQINKICCQYFWPDIDMAESLEYPEYSCVALYGHLIIGFAFAVPDVKWGEVYVSFIFVLPCWRNIGLASFMLYHLSQISYNKDLTLHVSSTNKSMLLYQKFGFKIEQFIVGFYNRYMHRENNDSRDAFFMRLRKTL